MASGARDCVGWVVKAGRGLPSISAWVWSSASRSPRKCLQLDAIASSDSLRPLRRAS